IDSAGVHAPKLRDVLLVVLDHLLDVFAVEFRALQLAQAVHHGILFRSLVVELHALVCGQLHQLLVGVAVVLHHALTELLDHLAGGLALGKPPHPALTMKWGSVRCRLVSVVALGCCAAAVQARASTPSVATVAIIMCARLMRLSLLPDDVDCYQAISTARSQRRCQGAGASHIAAISAAGIRFLHGRISMAAFPTPRRTAATVDLFRVSS